MTLIERLRARYEEIRTRLEAITNAAAADGEHGRSLNEAESAEIRTLTEEATALVPQIEQEVERLERDAQTQAMFSRVAVSGPGANTGARSLPVRDVDTVNAGADGANSDALDDAQVRAAMGERAESGTLTRERDPGIYVRSSHIEAGDLRGERTHSFFHDLVHASEGDTGARDRLGRHHRALSNASQGAGLV